jgi:hypothetical protein
MTFRAQPLHSDERLTVDTPEARGIVARYVSGTTWSHAGPRYVDVLFLGERLAVLKLRGLSPVEHRIVRRDDPKGRHSYGKPDVIKALAGGARDGRIFPVELEGRVSPKNLAAWIEQVRAADLQFDRVAADLDNAAKAAEEEAEARRRDLADASRAHARIVANALAGEGREVTIHAPETWARVEVRRAGSDVTRLVALFGPVGLVSVDVNGRDVTGGDVAPALALLAERVMA